MPKSRSRNLPAICTDEGTPRDVASAFRQYISVVEASQDNRFRGRDEKDYISMLYSLNMLFVTGDSEFIEYARNNGIKHAGLVYLPGDWTLDEKVTYAHIISGFIKGQCEYSRFALRNHLLYAGVEGLHDVTNKRDKMVFSWDWLNNQA